MKRHLHLWLVLMISAAVFGGTARAASDAAKPAVTDSQAKELAKAVTMVTGMAISPLLGVGAVGAYDWFQADTPEQKAKLPWYAKIHFWLPALLLVAVVAAKDALGTALPPGLKKPLDVAETVENKVTGLVAAGAVVPSIAAIFHSTVSAAVPPDVMQAGILGVSFAPLLNILTIPLAVTVFALVWLVGHVINVLILISPFGVVDAALKSARTALLGVLTAVHFINPVWGAVLSLIIIVIAYFVAGWSFRLMVFGSVYTWDFVTGKRKRFTPAPNGNWMFTARKIERTPVRTYGKLVKTEAGSLTFDYRPWLFGKRQTVALPAGKYAVGRGLFYPEIMLVEGEKAKSLLSLPPRYKKHEEEIAKAYGIAEIRDTGILKGIKAIWRWFTRNLFGKDSREAAVTAAA
jgi:hypothetical protein